MSMELALIGITGCIAMIVGLVMQSRKAGQAALHRRNLRGTSDAVRRAEDARSGTRARGPKLAERMRGDSDEG